MPTLKKFLACSQRLALDAYMTASSLLDHDSRYHMLLNGLRRITPSMTTRDLVLVLLEIKCLIWPWPIWLLEQLACPPNHPVDFACRKMFS